MRRVSIEAKLRRLFMLISTVVLLLASVGFLAADLKSSRREIVDDLAALADVVGLNSSAPLLFADADSAHEVLGALRAKPSIVAAAVYTKNGTPFAIYKAEPRFITPSRPGATRVSGAIEVVREIHLDNEKIGFVYIASDSRHATDRMNQFLLMAGGILLLSLVVALVMAWRLQQIISVPILGLAAAARQVTGHKNYAIRVAPAGPTPQDEIGDLTLDFNEMLAEIERRDDELRRHRDDLERQVEERTSDLVAAKNAAEQIAEQNVQLSRHKKMILNGAGDGIFGLDRNGITTFINPSAARLLGWPIEELIGLPLHSVLHPAGFAVSQAACATCSSNLRPTTRTGRAESFQRRDGTILPVDYTASTIVDDAGIESGVVVTFRDVTERLAVERLKNEFVSTVSHELRTPLTSIRGALGLLGSGLLGSMNDRGQRMLDIAVSNTDRLVRLINDILDLERMESGRVELVRKHINAYDLMMEAAETVQAMADAAGVTLVIEPVRATVWVDRDRMIQTLTNLVGNAVKFSPRGGIVRLGGAMDGKFTMSVRDEGRGIPADKLETIFERFKQADASDSREKGGSGLGLAICRSIVNGHGGRIWAESVEGKGSTFTIALPDEPVFDVRERAQNLKKTVVVYSNDRPGSPHIAEAFERHGFRVVPVNAADDLLAAAAESRPQAIIVDLEPSGESGWPLVQALKMHEATSRIPIVLTSVKAPCIPEDYADLIIRWIPRSGEVSELVQAVILSVDEPSVLIVEDDADLAGVMMISLQARGIKTVHAANGREAIEACKQQVPALVVLDLVLPELDGYAVVEWMRDNSALEKTPLMVFSAQEVTSVDQRRLRLGPTEFLTKSRVSLDDVSRRVAALLNTVTQSMEVAGAA